MNVLFSLSLCTIVISLSTLLINSTKVKFPRIICASSMYCYVHLSFSLYLYIHMCVFVVIVFGGYQVRMILASLDELE